jgi:hypothetical protein
MGSDPALSQEEPTVIYEVGYMKVAPEKAAEYLDLEQKTWKPIHQERVKSGLIVGWDLYAVWYPGGTDAPYQYVTVNTYDDLAKVENSFSEDLVRRAHPNVDMEDFTRKTLAARDLARSELWIQRDLAKVDTEGVKVGDYLMIGYMKVPPGGVGDYLRMEREIYKPIHLTRIADGWIDNWGINQLFLPGGTGGEYNWATFQVYRDFGKMLGGSPGTFKKAHPGLTPSVFQSASDLRDMVRVDLWELVDQVR